MGNIKYILLLLSTVVGCANYTLYDSVEHKSTVLTPTISYDTLHVNMRRWINNHPNMQATIKNYTLTVTGCYVIRDPKHILSHSLVAYYNIQFAVNHITTITSTTIKYGIGCYDDKRIYWVTEGDVVRATNYVNSIVVNLEEYVISP